MSRSPPPSYARALETLAAAVRDAQALADLMEYGRALDAQAAGRAAGCDGWLL
jgi:hypothetical protein